MGHYEDKIWCDAIHMNIVHIVFGRPWLFYQKVHHDNKANTYTILWNGKRVMLVPMTSTASSSSTSSPSTEPKKEPQEEHRVERVVMIAPQEIQVMPADIKRVIDDQGQGKADLM